MRRGTFNIIQEPTICVIFLVVAIVLTVVYPASSGPTPLSARVTDAYDALEKEPSKLKEVGRKPFHRRNSHHHFHQHHGQNIFIAQQKDTYTLVRSLRKIQGPDGLSPVCRICQINFVDAETYDYFCLPESDGMNGVTCDTLTFLGTTTESNINLSCKHLRPRITVTCK